MPSCTAVHWASIRECLPDTTPLPVPSTLPQQCQRDAEAATHSHRRRAQLYSSPSSIPSRRLHRWLPEHQRWAPGLRRFTPAPSQAGTAPAEVSRCSLTLAPPFPCTGGVASPAPAQGSASAEAVGRLRQNLWVRCEGDEQGQEEQGAEELAAGAARGGAAGGGSPGGEDLPGAEGLRRSEVVDHPQQPGAVGREVEAADERPQLRRGRGRGGQPLRQAG